MRNHIIAVLALALAAPAAAQGVPAPIKARVNDLVAQCARAGGTLGSMTGQGQFVIPRDFSGDGRTDFLVSEGNFPCTGRPNLFRQDGLARVQLYLGDGAGGASLAFDQRLLGYRVLDGKPVRLQVARRGQICGTGAGATTRCGDELVWDATARAFGLKPTDGRAGGTQLAARPASPTTQPVSTAGGAPGPAPAALPMVANAETLFKAGCRKKTLSGNPGAARWVDDECAERWKTVVAAGPAADALLAVLSANAGATITTAEAKARMKGVRWTGQSGRLGNLAVTLEGGRAPERASVGWSEIGAMIPYDVVGAMEARGAKLTLMSCEKLGTGEFTHAYSGTAPGRATFGLTVDSRTAPTANANSHYGATVTLNGRTPPRGSTACGE